MRRNSWHILRQDDALTVARHLPPRFDVAAAADLPAARALSLRRLAQQVRQDIWRALRNLRGFSPVVRVTDLGRVLRIEAGGRLADPRRAGGAGDVLAAVLSDPANHGRWLRHAERRA
ncbi:hypothetical protein OB2597_15280 [Pseudooceanicola batsensis HTCC2597]|uniref:Uncharacterized protein n=1 Tax=Pseudooceanicola batsensis (strain ATCC BAA-863 / DSM 15984 / KCTC 12145 / HTCC2597) TaxID=252305 RepID=A3TYT8_PSEBH|nr:hypothetical protein [Pseudooceanicola batsensis]EAQ02756.1 hypothetical protein OB2597_15280 [Pseudooceanicola batsensis HTCC2597]